MYSIYADEICIYSSVSPLDNLKVDAPTLELAESSAGSLKMTIPKGNVGYDYIKKLSTDITVKKHGNEIWSGRVLTEDKDFYGNRILYCEGELAFLNDTRQPRGEYHSITVRGFLEILIANHNSKVPMNRRFTVGDVTVTDPNDSLYRFTNRETTLECIQTKLIEKLGGIIRVRKSGKTRYIDYLADYPHINTQVIQFGSNLVDLKKTWDLTDFSTVILPLGCHLEESEIEKLDAYLTVASVNDEAFKIVVDKDPFRIQTTGTNLLDYVVYGSSSGVGDYNNISGKYDIPVTVVGKNLFDKANPNLTHLYPYINTGIVKTSSTRWSALITVKPNTSYVLSKIHQSSGTSIRVAGYSSEPVYNMEPDFLDETAETPAGSARDVQKFTTGQNTHYILCFLRSDDNQDALNDVVNSLMIEEGSEMTEYEAYRKSTFVIQLDAPLATDESVSMTQSGININTVAGKNTITVDTVNKPEKVLIQYLTDETREYVQSAQAVKEFGWIEKVVNWDDITTPSRLLSKAKKYLSDTQFSETTIELSAVDLNYLDISYEEINLLDKIRVISPFHGMDRYFPVTKLEIPLDTLEAAVFSLGGTYKTGISSMTNRNQSAVINAITSSANDTRETLRQEFVAADGILSSRIDGKAESSDVDELSTSINQSLESIRTEVSRKVGTSEFGSYMQQNYNSFLIGFNNSDNKTIRLSTAGITIYSGTAVDDQNKLISLEKSGLQIWSQGHRIGSMGTISHSSQSSYIGLSFSLDANGSFMSWGSRNVEEGPYLTRLVYAAKLGAIYNSVGFYVYDKFFFDGHELNSANLTDVRSNGFSTYTGQRSFVTGVTDNHDGTYSFDISTFSIKNGMFVQ